MSDAPETILVGLSAWGDLSIDSHGLRMYPDDLLPHVEYTLTAKARADLDAAVALALEEAADCRKWFHYPIEMPVTAEGQGPATVGVDAVEITYEVWDELLRSHASFDNLPDAINEAMRLNAARAALQSTPAQKEQSDE